MVVRNVSADKIKPSGGFGNCVSNSPTLRMHERSSSCTVLSAESDRDGSYHLISSPDVSSDDVLLHLKDIWSIGAPDSETVAITTRSTAFYRVFKFSTIRKIAQHQNKGIRYINNIVLTIWIRGLRFFITL